MIRKSGSRFSDKIMRQETRSLYNWTPAASMVRQYTAGQYTARQYTSPGWGEVMRSRRHASPLHRHAEPANCRNQPGWSFANG
jgi:hypothetical protein